MSFVTEYTPGPHTVGRWTTGVRCVPASLLKPGEKYVVTKYHSGNFVGEHVCSDWNRSTFKVIEAQSESLAAGSVIEVPHVHAWFYIAKEVAEPEANG